MNNLVKLLTMGCTCTKESLQIDGRKFYILSRLGEGGFSYVDLIEDSQTKKKYAVKRIVCYSKEDENIAIAEVNYMKMFDHQNLVPLEYSDLHRLTSNKRSATAEVLIVMPFYSRGTLFDEIERRSSRGEIIPQDRLLDLFRGICEGLKQLHMNKPQSVTHRDIKPHNVLLANDDTPVLMDFGSMGPGVEEIQSSSEARKLQDLAAERCSMPYRAPELFNVESQSTVNDRIDIWSLGCTLYAMCFHESPFDKAYQRGDSIALAVLAGNIKFPETNHYTLDFPALINDMLQVDPKKRPHITEVISRVEAMRSISQNRV